MRVYADVLLSHMGSSFIIILDAVYCLPKLFQVKVSIGTSHFLIICMVLYIWCSVCCSCVCGPGILVCSLLCIRFEQQILLLFMSPFSPLGLGVERVGLDTTPFILHAIFHTAPSLDWSVNLEPYASLLPLLC